jgi:ATP-dependent Lon protease
VILTAAGRGLQVIRIPGYIADEKVHIARQYLEPQSMRESGVPEAAASISDSAMHTLIHEYARHAFKSSLSAAMLRGGCLCSWKLVARK